MRHLFLGVDIGTSSVKLILVDETGEVLVQESAEYRVDQPKTGWSEIDPDVWYIAFAACLKRLLSNTDPSMIEGIGVTGQMHTTAFMDVYGKSIRPALMWMDKRTKQYIPSLKEEISRHPEISYIGNIISTGSPASNLYWLRKNEPENFAKLYKFLIGPDYIVYRLTGVYGTDYCEASTSSLYDIRKRCWSDSMREIIGIPNSVYPEVRGSAQIVGKLRPEIAAEFGLSEDVNVIAGTGDNPAAAITTGCLGYGYPVISLGTSGVLMLSRDQLNFDAKGKNILFSFDNENFFYLVQGVVQSAGASYMWWTRDILEMEDIAEIDVHIDINTAVKSPLIFYPHLSGEKTLYADPNLQGAFIGLSTETTRWDMAYAVMEGISFGFRELADKMCFQWDKYQSIKVAGGGAKNSVWMQTMADVLGIRIEQLDGSISASLGIALLAAYSCGRIDELKEISNKGIKINGCFEPRPEFKELYAKKFSRYLKIHDAVKEIEEDC